MLFLLSGEGPTDLGECVMDQPRCDSDEFAVGPLALLVAALVEPRIGYSILDPGHCRFVPRPELNRIAAGLSPRRNGRVPGRDRPRETRYFSNSARAMAKVALDMQAERGDEVVAVLFRDADTIVRQDWETKWQSMMDGFEREGLTTGVPLLPQPTSEAWLLCIFRNPSYQGCEHLEDRNSNPSAQRPLKDELENVLGQKSTRQSLLERVQATGVDVGRITMPSFLASRVRMASVLQQLLGGAPP